jgi:hypothetical protein
MKHRVRKDKAGMNAAKRGRMRQLSMSAAAFS